MNRRKATFSLLALGVPLATSAQPTKEKVYVLGFLSSGPRPPEPKSGAKPGPLLSAMAALGYTEGRNLRFEWRFADGNSERLAALAAELARLPVDVILANGTTAALAVQKATSSVPVVMIALSPVEAGLVKSLARPGGNITGIALDDGFQVSGKRLEILKATVPGLRRVALMASASAFSSVIEKWREEAAGAARALGLSARPIDLPLDRARWGEVFRRAAAERLGAAMVLEAPYIDEHRAQLARTALEYRMPILSSARIAEAGGLMAYGANRDAYNRRAASYVDRIFKGAKPGDLPVELPGDYELTVNLKTAKALSITIPRSVLLQASRVIE